MDWFNILKLRRVVPAHSFLPEQDKPYKVTFASRKCFKELTDYLTSALGVSKNVRNTDEFEGRFDSNRISGYLNREVRIPDYKYCVILDYLKNFVNSSPTVRSNRYSYDTKFLDDDLKISYSRRERENVTMQVYSYSNRAVIFTCTLYFEE